MPDAVIATDHNGKIRSINAAAEGITGWAANDAVGRELREVFRVKSTWGAPTRRVNVLLTRGGDTVAVEGRAEGIHDANGCLKEVLFHFSRSKPSPVFVMPKPDTGPGLDAA